MYVLDEHIARRREIHTYYEQALANVPGITVMTPRSAVENLPNYWLSCILINPEEAGFTYQELSAKLSENEIESRPLWKPMHLQPVFKDAPHYTNGLSESKFNIGLCLPSGPMVTNEDLERILQLFM